MLMAVVLCGITACKPTEKHYREAYDAALRKRQIAEAEQMLPARGKLLSDEGPQMRVLDGDTLFVTREQLRTEDGTPLPFPWLVAVGVYKMSTNARSNAAALREEGYAEAMALRAADDRWYTVAAGAFSLDSVRPLAARFRDAHPGYPYIGLPGAPVLISAY